MSTHLLPANASVLERAFAHSSDVIAHLEGDVSAIRGFKFKRPLNDTIQEALLSEYGLRELQAYVPESELLLAHGVDWFRKLGTPIALSGALSFLGFQGNLEEAPLRRNRWSDIQFALYQLLSNEKLNTENLSGLVSMALPARSKFYRGFYNYDVRALEAGWSKLGQSLLAADSGVRLDPKGPLWSFGREHRVEVVLTRSLLEALGLWIDQSSQPFTWATANFSWARAHFPWGAAIDTVRSQIMAAGLAALRSWFEFMHGDEVIGYRCARVFMQASKGVDGSYRFGSEALRPDLASRYIYAEALTEFGDAIGATVSAVNLVFGATLKPEVKPGTRWVNPQQIDLTNVSRLPLNISDFNFDSTRRERIKALLEVPL